MDDLGKSDKHHKTSCQKGCCRTQAPISKVLRVETILLYHPRFSSCAIWITILCGYEMGKYPIKM